MTADPKKSQPGTVAPSPFERTMALDPGDPTASRERHVTEVLTVDAQVAGAERSAQIPPSAPAQAHVPPSNAPTPSASGVHPRTHGTLVMEPLAGQSAPPTTPTASPPAALAFGAAPTFGPPPAPNAAGARKNPLEGMSLTGTAVVEVNDEVVRARERLRIGDARATQLGVARLSAASEPPTSTRAPFRITPPSPSSERESRPTLPPWLEQPAVAAPRMRHPLERTQETSPMADVFEKIVPGMAPTPRGEEVWQPAPKTEEQLSPDDTLTSPRRALLQAVADEAYRPAGTPIVGPSVAADPVHPGQSAAAPATSEPNAPAASPYGRDLPAEELAAVHSPYGAATAPTKAEPPRAPERKSVSGGLYSKFGKK